MFAHGSGISNKLTAFSERVDRAAALENYAERAKQLGKFPGTHTLGKEFETPKKEK